MKFPSVSSTPDDGVMKSTNVTETCFINELKKGEITGSVATTVVATQSKILSGQGRRVKLVGLTAVRTLIVTPNIAL